MSRRFVLSCSLAVFALALAAVPAYSAVSAGNTGWRWSNPQPQGNSLRTVDFVGARGYAGGAAGTLLRSDDQGASWSSVRSGLTDDITLVRTVGADTIVFTSGCALRRSDDGGATITRLPWTSNDFSCNPGIKSLAFPTVDVGYLLLGNGAVYVTADKGQSWSLATSIPNTPSVGGGATPGDIHFTSASDGVATAGNAIFRTTNGGSSWTLVSSSAPGQLRKFAFSSAGDGFVVGDNSGALYTNDGGASFTPVSASPSADLYDVDCATTLLCVARARDGLTIRRTDDGGATWTSIAPTSLGVSGLAYASGSRAIGVGGSGTIIISNDGGAGWTSISASVAGTFYNLRVNSANSAYVFGQSGALARTVDGGNSWTRFNVLTAGDVIDVEFPAASEGFALDSQGGLLRSKNGGISWQVLDTGTTADPRALYAPSTTTIALVGPLGVRLSSDGGSNFRLLADRRLKRSRLSHVDQAGSLVFAYGGSSIYSSNTKAAKWKPVKGPRRRTIEVLDFVGAKTGFVLDTAGEIWKTVNGGKRWALLGSFGRNNADVDYFNSMAWGDAKHGYVSGPSAPVVYTNDGGKTWSEQIAFASFDGAGSVRLATAGVNSAFALRSGSSSIIATNSGGRIGTQSTLKLKPTRTKVKRGAQLKVGGSLSPAVGGELVTIAARAAGARPGSRWSYQNVIVSSTGTFTSVWSIRRPMVFAGWWSGDAAHDGDGASPVTVKLKR